MNGRGGACLGGFKALKLVKTVKGLTMFPIVSVSSFREEFRCTDLYNTPNVIIIQVNITTHGVAVKSCKCRKMYL